MGSFRQGVDWDHSGVRWDHLGKGLIGIIQAVGQPRPTDSITQQTQSQQSLAVPIASSTHFWTPLGSNPISAMQSITVVAISAMHPQPSPSSQTPSFGSLADLATGILLKMLSMPFL